MTFACGGMPRAAETYTNFGNVVTLPELKFVMMKSSKDSANASSAAARMPGAASGSVTRRNVCHSSA